jgi:hypothetical protein
VEYNADAPSFARNSARDVVPLSSWQLFADIVRQGIVPALHNHLEPGIAPRGWWRGLGRVFPRVLITAGEYEGIVDPIQRTVAVIAEEVEDTTVTTVSSCLEAYMWISSRHLRRARVREGMTTNSLCRGCHRV